MGDAKYIGRVGALAAWLGVGNVRRTATRMTVSIGAAAVVVMATVVPASTASASSSDVPPPDKTALLMGGTTIPTLNDADVEAIMKQFIAPTHPRDTIEPVAVTTPEELWPLTGLLRLLASALGPPSIFGAGGSGWPDEPWWKLSGLFDLTFDQSVQAGVADLERVMATYGNDHLVISGGSQGAAVAIREKQRLAAQYPIGSKAPDIDFAVAGDPNLPNGGLFARFPGLYIPILDISLNGPERTDTQFDTVVITRQYDAFADFPLYPLNLVADMNAVLGFFYVHMYIFDVSLAPDPSASPPIKTQYGDTTYYFFETQDLPLFGPLRTLGVPEALIDVVEPFFKVIADLGYDRSIPPGEPTPARLIPSLDPATVATDLVNAIGEGINNAAALLGAPPPLSIPAPVTLAAPATETTQADTSQQVTAPDTPTPTERVTSTGTAVANMVPAAGPPESTATQRPADPASGTETVKADFAPQVTPTETETSDVTSTEKATETAKANDAETGPRATPNPSVSASTPEPVKPAGEPATPRPVLRGSLGVRDLPHRGNGGRQITRNSAAGDKAPTAGPSSVASPSAASSSTGSNSSGGESSDGGSSRGDAGDS